MQRDLLNQVDELPIVRHVTVYVRVGEICSPQDPLRGIVCQHPGELYSIRKGWLLVGDPINAT